MLDHTLKTSDDSLKYTDYADLVVQIFYNTKYLILQYIFVLYYCITAEKKIFLYLLKRAKIVKTARGTK